MHGSFDVVTVNEFAELIDWKSQCPSDTFSSSARKKNLERKNCH